MTMARKRLVWAGRRGGYHCMVRCVRRAFLCGEDPYSGVNYDHRKEWVRSDKSGVISPEVRPLLESLELDPEEWVETVRSYGKRFGIVAGTVEHIREAAFSLGRRWLKGCRSCEAAFLSLERAPPQSA